MKTTTCPLCRYPSFVYFREKSKTWFLCSECSGIFLERNSLPGRNDEIARYKEHNNDVEDAGYQNFVRPIVTRILESFSPEDTGLDFGAGTGPVISKLLSNSGYQIKQYDPFFHDYPDLLQQTYDYIACCEVVEHFHHPQKEFELLKGMLNTEGKLYCMTSLYSAETDFKSWYYKNDPTHVFFYQHKTMEYIRELLEFTSVDFYKNLIVFSN
jgi:ubiquinone/menaquinone biosynthesis C-methylase UbiE